MGRKAHTGVGAALRRGDQVKVQSLTAAFAQDGNVDAQLAAVNRFFAEKLIVLDLSGRGEDRVGQLDFRVVRFEVDLVPIQVIAVGDPPLHPHHIRGNGLGGKLKGLIGRQQVIRVDARGVGHGRPKP